MLPSYQGIMLPILMLKQGNPTPQDESRNAAALSWKIS
jgi:hypothetical protein